MLTNVDQERSTAHGEQVERSLLSAHKAELVALLARLGLADCLELLTATPVRGSEVGRPKRQQWEEPGRAGVPLAGGDYVEGRSLSAASLLARTAVRERDLSRPDASDLARTGRDATRGDAIAVSVHPFRSAR
jgi:hypothetical protein